MFANVSEAIEGLTVKAKAFREAAQRFAAEGNMKAAKKAAAQAAKMERLVALMKRDRQP